MHKVLLADDQEEQRLLLEATLADEGYELIAASTGPEALALARSEKPSVILLDWMLPGMSGLAVAQALKLDPTTAGIPIVLLTARNQAEDRYKGQAAGVSLYLSKPFSPIELVEHMDRLLHAGVP